MRHDIEGQIGSQAQPGALAASKDDFTADPSPVCPWIPVWPPKWPEIRESLDRCFESGQWGRYEGETLTKLREKLSESLLGRHCRLVASGSFGVEIALRGLGVATGDEVILCAYDYPGNFRAVESVGARPVLIDADPNGYSVNPSDMDAAASPEVKAVIVSHLYGIAADIEPIREHCDRARMEADRGRVSGPRDVRRRQARRLLG